MFSVSLLSGQALGGGQRDLSQHEAQQGQYVNKSICFYTGRSRSYYLSHTAGEMYADDEVPFTMYDEVVRTKKAVTRLQPTRRGDGSIIMLLNTQMPVFNEQGEVDYCICFERDIENEVKVYLENRVLTSEQSAMSLPPEPPQMVYKSPAMQALIQMLDPIIPTNVPILIQGDTGTGKEVLARYIHYNSKLSKKPLVAINCAALPESLLESELFGYEKGAFTGAASSGKKGIFEEADGGTLFLDEINSFPLSLQPKLLRILETSEVRRLGATKGKRINFRLITATNADLKECVANGTFRLDLLYRINAMTVTIPALQDRKDDIIPLANHYLEQFCRQYRCEKHFSVTVYNELLAYSRPGNIRELRNVVERLVLTSPPSSREIDSFAQTLESSYSIYPSHTAPIAVSAYQEAQHAAGLLSFWDQSRSLSENVETYEQAILREAYNKYGTTTRIAEKLMVDQSTISRKLNKYGITNGKKR